jgi:acyl-CoA hydrolase
MLIYFSAVRKNEPTITTGPRMNLPEKVALPTDQELVLKVIPMPANCNAKGDIFGDWVMAQVDLAGAGR